MRSRIALNALALRPDGSGVQVYIRELLRALAPLVDATLVADVQADAADELPDGVEPRVHPVADGVRRAFAGLRAPVPADLVHGLDASLPVGVKAPTVVTVHDIAVFDVPWAFSRRRVIGKRLQLRHALRRADAVIAVSEFTAERIRARFRREAVIVPEAPPPDCSPPSSSRVDDVRQRYGLPERFVLHVGVVDPRKNLGALSAACIEARLPLVLAGAPPARGEDPGLRARLLGHVPRTDLLALYGAATIVAYPSRYEGFGLPPLEAVACGAAVVASPVASLPDLLGDGAIFIDPDDVSAMARAFGELADDEDRRRALVDTARRRIVSLTWNRAAESTVDVYRSLGVECRPVA